MRTVVLVQPEVGLLDKVKNAPAIPLSLITAATNLTPNYEVKIIDQRLDKSWKATLIKELKDNPVCVGTTAMLGPQVGHALEICKLVKGNSEVPTVWGGPQGGIMPEITIRHPHVDVLIQGDAENSLRRLVDTLSNKDPFAKGIPRDTIPGIPGIYCENNLGGINFGRPRELLDINTLPDPLYNLVEVQRYLPVRYGKPTIDIESSRGCPFSCTFCYNPFLHKRNWRALSAERTLARVDKLHADYGVSSFWFIDDEFFGTDLERALDIITGMKKRKFTWTIQGTTIFNVLRMDNDYLKTLSESGCKQLNIGVESGSPRLLKELNKNVKPSQVLEINKRLKDYNIVPSYYFIVGFPTETLADFNLTIDLIKQLLDENPMATIMNIGIYTPYPSSKLMETCKNKGYKPPETLEDYITYGVDEINTPWVLNNPEVLTRVRGANFCNYFLDNKTNNLEIQRYLKIPFKLYQPIAKWRFNHKAFRFPVDISLGNFIKRRISK